MELTTSEQSSPPSSLLFMMSKIQNLNGTHNKSMSNAQYSAVVYDVKDTKFEWNSQHEFEYLPARYGCL